MGAINQNNLVILSLIGRIQKNWFKLTAKLQLKSMIVVEAALVLRSLLVILN
jgi:hypothetical protein